MHAAQQAQATSLTAAITKVSAETGAVIMDHRDLPVALLAGQGLLGTAVEAAITNGGETTVDNVIARYGADYRDWLLRRA